ncbi:MAG: hypothetical protein RIR26_2657 [Pseudomonadota bacterium]|jgi:hypothetical protein
MFCLRKAFFFPLGFLLTSCASGRLLVTVEPPSAEIRMIESLAAVRNANAGRLLGKGTVSLGKSEYSRKLFLLSAAGHEPLAFFVPEVGSDEQVKVTLFKEDGKLAREAASLRSELDAERRANSQLKEALQKQNNAKHNVGLQLAQLQRVLTLSMNEDAEIAAGELFKISEEFLPATAFVLRAKLRLLQGKSLEAKADLQKALRLSPAEREAKALLESLK